MINYSERQCWFKVIRPVPEELGPELDTVPVRAPFFANPLDFANYSAENRHITLHRLGNYRLFVSSVDTDLNYAPRPSNMAYDTQNILTLYSEFGPPTLDPKKQASALAVCGFNIMGCKGEIVQDGELYPVDGKVLNVAQFQTTSFKDEREMMHYLGFIKYKKLFMHTIEQIAIHLRNHGQNINFTSLATDERKDRFIANMRLMSVVTPDKQSTIENMMAGIRQEREEFAQSIGYKRILSMPVYGNIGSNLAFAKSLDDIEPDEVLQRHFSKILT